MPFDLRRIAESQKKALALVENPDRREVLERFLESSGPLVEAATREVLHELVEEINVQLAPHARLRLIQEGSNVVPEIVRLGEEISRGRRRVIDRGTISKVLVRMPSNVKTRATEAAHKAGTSLNSWTVNVLDRALVGLREHQERADRTESKGKDIGVADPTQEPGPSS